MYNIIIQLFLINIFKIKAIKFVHFVQVFVHKLLKVISMKNLKEVEKLFALSVLERMYEDKLLSKDEYYKCIDEFKKIVEKRDIKNV